MKQETKKNLIKLVEKIKRILTLTDNQVYEILGLSKTEFDEIISGRKQLKADLSKKLFELSLLVDDWCAFGHSLTLDELTSPVLKHESIWDMLLKSEVDREGILFAASRIAISRPDFCSVEIPDPFHLK
ncbi:hypothetical protein [Aliikangiella sp. IMCC44632]